MVTLFPFEVELNTTKSEVYKDNCYVAFSCVTSENNLYMSTYTI